MEKAPTKKAIYLNGMLTLPSIDVALQTSKGANAVEVVAALAMVPDMQKRIE